MKKFCTEMDGLENLCSCVSADLFDPTEGDGKVERCLFARHSCTLPDWKLKGKKERNKHRQFCSTCKITNFGYCIKWQ
jgi:hypothetical protein